MDDRFQSDTPPPAVVLRQPGLPAWLGRRVLRPDEEIVRVRGPRYNPECERYLTHPGLIVVALALGAVCLGVGRALSDSWNQLSPVAGLAAIVVVFGGVYLLASANAYFTRLVVTNKRVFILQGYEIRDSWGIDDLPRHLIRYDRRGGEESRTIDLDALQTMLGGSSDGFIESKTIIAFSKQIDRIRKKGRDDDQTLRGV